MLNAEHADKRIEDYLLVGETVTACFRHESALMMVFQSGFSVLISTDRVVALPKATTCRILREYQERIQQLLLGLGESL